MTAGKYGRLCIVLFIPLMFLGYLISLYNNPFNAYENFLCDPNCRNLGPMDGRLYNSVVKDYEYLFSVMIDNKESYLRHNIQAVLPTIRDAKILNAIPRAPNASPSVFVDGYDIVGMKANLLFGLAGDNSIIGDKAYLYCNMLLLEDEYIQDDSGSYTASCHSDVSTFLEKIRFSVSGHSKDILDEMISSIKLSIDRRETEYLLYRIVIYPILIYIFLVLSALAWVTVKAVRFVKNG